MTRINSFSGLPPPASTVPADPAAASLRGSLWNTSAHTPCEYGFIAWLEPDQLKTVLRSLQGALAGLGPSGASSNAGFELRSQIDEVQQLIKEKEQDKLDEEHRLQAD